MSMKCPVCKNECNINDKECSICGFTELNVEFLNEEEAAEWEGVVLKPCRSLWNAHKNMYDKLLTDYQELNKKYLTLQKNYSLLGGEYDDLRRDFDNLKSLSPRVPASVTNPKPGWNTTGPIAHPNFFTSAFFGSTKCEVSNISSMRSGSQIVVNFLAKKIYDKSGAVGTERISFKYKIKNSMGIVVATNSWVQLNLSVGDVVRGSFTINGIAEKGYTLEFFDYND